MGSYCTILSNITACVYMCLHVWFSITAAIDELTQLSEDVACKRNSKAECGRGTVVMDPWVNRTIYFQSRLAQNVSINLQQILGSHNSFNDKADG